MNNKIVVLVGTDDAQRRQTVCSHFMEDDADRRMRPITCEAVTLDRVLDRSARLQPDVLLIDPAEGSAGWHLAELQRTSPDTRRLLMCHRLTPQFVVEAIREGASGYLLDSADRAQVRKAVRTVYSGATWFGRNMLYQALHSLVCTASITPHHEEGKLTRREEQILDLIGSGLSNKEIGRRLAISDKTVKTHLHRIYVKLNMSGRYKAFLAQPFHDSGNGALASHDDLSWATLSKLIGPTV
jgi:DNA-binding NarL/FixJ family response regulator